ncbi:MAG: crotonase/enoyl-CoA hydratase family protein [Polyangiaceae bacterium]
MTRISYEVEDSLALIGLARPEKRNAFDRAMLDELGRAYTAYEHNADLRCALLFAHGDHFTGGLDLAGLGPELGGGAPLFPPSEIDPVGLGPRRRQKPVVVAVRGYCFTLGIELALAADVVLAADDTRFAQIEVQRGIFPFAGATLRFPAQCGWGNAMRWLLTGDYFDAAEALRIGLVQEVVPAAELMARARFVAERIAAQAPLAVRATLASARGARDDGFDAEAHRLKERASALFGSEDAVEGTRSFVERRAATFHGR